MAQDAAKLRELKWLSGLSWEGVANLLGVDRREVYNWRACKKEMLTERQIALDGLLARHGGGFRLRFSGKEEP